MKLELDKYAIKRSSVKEWLELFKTIEKMNKFKKEHKIQNTNCFLTNVVKSFTWKNIKIKLSYDYEKGIILSSDKWISSCGKKKESIGFILYDNWSRVSMFSNKFLPRFTLFGNSGFEVPDEIGEAIFECFTMLTNNVVEINDTINKNIETFKRKTSLKNFGLNWWLLILLLF